MTRARVGKVLFFIFIVFILIWCIFPFAWTFLTSIKPRAEIISKPLPWIPSHIEPSYREAFTDVPLLRYIVNSAIVAVTTTVLCLVVGSLTAYALARLRFRGKTALLMIVLAVCMFPQIAIVGPLTRMFKTLHLLNTYPCLILPYMTFCLPLTVWILTTFFQTIPRDLENAALVDGCTRMESLRKVILPLAAPGLVTCAILVFIYAWNEFMFAQTFITEQSMYTITKGIAMYGGRYTIPYGEISAAAVAVTIPLIVLVLIFQRRIVQGLTAGSVKG